MASATMDHFISLIVFIAAILIFIGLFSQTIQTAVVYERHRALATKTSDLLDTMVLNPGLPVNWGNSAGSPTGFGLQDPEFTQYQLSPFSLMRLGDSTENVAEYDKTSPNNYYSNVSLGFGASLLTPNAQMLNYSFASTLLGINNTYGFQLTLTPTVTVSIAENHPSSPLGLSISANGIGFPFANAFLNYCLILVNLPQTEGQYPSYTLQNGAVTTDQLGMANITFSDVTAANQVYAFIAYAHLNGIEGVGYFTRSSNIDQYIVPTIQDMVSQQVVLAHNYDFNKASPQGFSLNYNITFVILKQDYTLCELSLGSSSPWGAVISGSGNPYPSFYMPAYTTGILIVSYQTTPTEGGVVLMPWGISSLAFPVTFGGSPLGHDWVSTDIRQVTIGGVAYQAKLAMWNLNYQGTG